jgi:hypothetical protein
MVQLEHAYRVFTVSGRIPGTREARAPALANFMASELRVVKRVRGVGSSDCRGGSEMWRREEERQADKWNFQDPPTEANFTRSYLCYVTNKIFTPLVSKWAGKG